MKIEVIAHTNSKRPRIEYDLLGALHVYVKEPPINGKANDEIRTALAKFYTVRKSKIKILKGNQSHNKQIEVIQA